MVAGQENSKIPVVKKDLLADFIVNYRSASLTAEQAAMLERRINSCKISK